MTNKILLRRGTAAEWSSANPILLNGEIGLETDTLKFKIGNGSSTWTQLSGYANVTPSGLSSSLSDYILAADLGVAGGPAQLNSSGNLIIPESSINFWNDNAYSYTTTLTTTQPTANRVITFPNATGTVALTSDITSAITNLINAAPSTLDTLNELAAAINNDSSFSTTVNNLLSGKVSKSGGDTITTATSSTVGLVIKGASSQTANLLEIQDSSGTVGTYFDLYGRLTVGAINGSTTAIINALATAGLMIAGQPSGNQVGLVGDGSGAFVQYGTSSNPVAYGKSGAFNSGLSFQGNARPIKLYNTSASGVVQQIIGQASQTGHLTEWQNSSGNVLALINSNGVVQTGAAIYSPYIQPSNGGANAFISLNNSTVLVDGWSASTVKLTVKGYTSQTAALQEWQNSAGTVLAKVDASGSINAVGLSLTSSAEGTMFTVDPTYGSIVSRGGAVGFNNAASLNIGTNYSAGSAIVASGYTGQSVPTVIIKSVTSQSSNLQEWQNSSGTALAYMSTNGHLVAQRVYAPDSLYVVANGGPGTVNIETYSNVTVGVITKGKASQTADLQQWQNSSGTVLAKVQASGIVNAPNGLEAGNTGLAVSAYGYNSVLGVNTAVATNIGAVIRGVPSQTANLQEWQNSSGTVLTKVDSTGQITSTNGTQYGTIGSSGFQSGGSSGITDIHYNAGNLTIRGGSAYNSNTSLLVGTGYAAGIGQIIKGVASQTANLQEWQNSAGSVLARVQSDGAFVSDYITAGSYLTSLGKLRAGAASSYGAQLEVTPTSASTIGAVIRGAASQTANLQEWQQSDGTATLYVAADGTVYITNNRALFVNSGYIGSASLVTKAAGPTWSGLIVKGAASQSANLQEWQNSSGTVLASINSSGTIFTLNGGTSGVGAAGRINLGDGYITKSYGGDMIFYGGLQSASEASIGTYTANYNATLAILALNNRIGAVIRSGSSQTTDLQQWQNNSGTVLAKVDVSGNITASSFVKSGGTSSQFLKADGSVDSNSYQPFSVNTTAKTSSYTIATSDYGTLIQMNGAYTFTVNTDLSAAPVGTQIHLLALTTGVSVTAVGTTINSTPGLKLRAAYSSATLICLGTNNWVLIGDLSA